MISKWHVFVYGVQFEIYIYLIYSRKEQKKEFTYINITVFNLKISHGNFTV